MDALADEFYRLAHDDVTGLDAPRQELLAATRAATGDAVLCYRG